MARWARRGNLRRSRDRLARRRVGLAGRRLRPAPVLGSRQCLRKRAAQGRRHRRGERRRDPGSRRRGRLVRGIASDPRLDRHDHDLRRAQGNADPPRPAPCLARDGRRRGRTDRRPGPVGRCGTCGTVRPLRSASGVGCLRRSAVAASAAWRLPPSTDACGAARTCSVHVRRPSERRDAGAAGRGSRPELDRCKASHGDGLVRSRFECGRCGRELRWFGRGAGRGAGAGGRDRGHERGSEREPPVDRSGPSPRERTTCDDPLAGRRTGGHPARIDDDRRRWGPRNGRRTHGESRDPTRPYRPALVADRRARPHRGVACCRDARAPGGGAETTELAAAPSRARLPGAPVGGDDHLRAARGPHPGPAGPPSGRRTATYHSRP